jgi:hypothetical protein
MATKPAFAENAQVEHPKFGPGTVLACDDQYIVVNFDDHGEKKFIAEIVIPNLVKLDRKPPEKKTRARRTRKATATKDTEADKAPKAAKKAKKTAKAAS